MTDKDYERLEQAKKSSPGVGPLSALVGGEGKPVGGGHHAGRLTDPKQKMGPPEPIDFDFPRRSETWPMDPEAGREPEVAKPRRGIETRSPLDDFEKHFVRVGKSGMFTQDWSDPASTMFDYLEDGNSWLNKPRPEDYPPGDQYDVIWSQKQARSMKWLNKRWKQLTNEEKSSYINALYKKYGRSSAVGNTRKRGPAFPGDRSGITGGGNDPPTWWNSKTGGVNFKKFLTTSSGGWRARNPHRRRKTHRVKEVPIQKLDIEF